MKSELEYFFTFLKCIDEICEKSHLEESAMLFSIKDFMDFHKKFKSFYTHEAVEEMSRAILGGSILLTDHEIDTCHHADDDNDAEKSESKFDLHNPSKNLI